MFRCLALAATAWLLLPDVSRTREGTVSSVVAPQGPTVTPDGTATAERPLECFLALLIPPAGALLTSLAFRSLATRDTRTHLRQERMDAGVVVVAGSTWPKRWPGSRGQTRTRERETREQEAAPETGLHALLRSPDASERMGKREEGSRGLFDRKKFFPREIDCSPAAVHVRKEDIDF